jgi:hypothetical protein
VGEEKKVLKNRRIVHLNMTRMNVIAPSYAATTAARISIANMRKGSF